MMTTRCLTIDLEANKHFGHVSLTLVPRGGHGAVTLSTAADDAGEALLEVLSAFVFAFGTPTEEDDQA